MTDRGTEAQSAAEAEDLAYELRLMETVEALDLKETDTSDMIMRKLGTLFETKD